MDPAMRVRHPTSPCTRPTRPPGLGHRDPELGFLWPRRRNPESCGQDSCGQDENFPSWGECISPHRGSALHPMGEIFIQDSSRKPFKNHTIRLPAGFPTSPHRQINFTLWVRFSYRIPGHRNPDSCILFAGFLLLGHRIPGLGFLWPSSRGRLRWAMGWWLALASNAVTSPAKAEPNRRSWPSGSPGRLQ